MNKTEKQFVLPTMVLFALMALMTLSWPLSGLFAALLTGATIVMLSWPEPEKPKPQKPRPKSKQTNKVAGGCPFLFPKVPTKPAPLIVIASDWRVRKD